MAQCKNGCGFFGNPACAGYCSSCYKVCVPSASAQASSGGGPVAVQSGPNADNPSAGPPMAVSDSISPTNGSATLPSTATSSSDATTPASQPTPKPVSQSVADTSTAASPTVPAEQKSSEETQAEPPDSPSRYAYLKGIPEAHLNKQALDATLALTKGQLKDSKIANVTYCAEEKALRLDFSDTIDKSTLGSQLAMLGAALGAQELKLELVADRWHVNDAEKGVQGISLEELRKQVQSGDIKPEAEVRHSVLYKSWTPVREIKELQDCVKQDEDVEMEDCSEEKIEELQASKLMDFAGWAHVHFPDCISALKSKGMKWALDKRTTRPQVIELLAPLKLNIEARGRFFAKMDLLQKHDAIHPESCLNWGLGDDVQVYNKKKEEWFIDGKIIVVGTDAKVGKFQIAYDKAKKKKWAAWGSMRPPLVDVPSTKKRKLQEDGKRCWFCNKRLKLMNSWRCKCLDKSMPNARFCTGCRNPGSHQCTEDFQKEQRERLIKQNPLIAPAKLAKMGRDV